MRMSVEAQMRPIWEGPSTNLVGRPKTEDLVAVEAWIDAQEARPDLALDMYDFEWVLLRMRHGWRGGKVEGTSSFESRILSHRDRHRLVKSELDRTMQRLGIPQPRREEVMRSSVEALLLAAMLSPQQCRIFELAMRLVHEDGRPDLVEITKLIDREDGGTGRLTRATVSVQLERGQEKLRRYLLYMGA